MDTLRTDGLIGAMPIERSAPSVRSIPRPWKIALVLGDLIMFVAASLAATAFVYFYWNASIELTRVLLSTAIFTTLWLAIFDQLGLYRRSFAMTMRDEFYYTAAALIIGVTPQLVLFTLVPSISTSRVQLLLALAFSIVGVSAVRTVLRRAHDIATPVRRRVVVVGHAQRLHDAVETVRTNGNAFVYWLAVRDIDATLRDAARKGPQAFAEIPWFREALSFGAERIIFTEIPDPEVVPHLVTTAAMQNVTLAFAPPRIRAHAYTLSMEKMGSQALIVPRLLPACTVGSRIIKRAFDVALAGIAVVVLSPIMATVAAVLFFDRSGPVLYRQQRVGRDGAAFDILKFRTMRADAERDGARYATLGDVRVTRVGRFLRRTSLDELPQLFNVLRGEMSVVGPRPERPVFVDAFRRRILRYDERHLVKPGITGWSQVHMARVLDDSDIEEKLAHDLFYVENWSPFLDITVVVKTGAEFLFHRAA